jgi:hypothetical protein
MLRLTLILTVIFLEIKLRIEVTKATTIVKKFSVIVNQDCFSYNA